MFSKSAWLHLRIPFSFFLLPVYFFALCISSNFTQPRMLWVLAIVHLFLYPASNGFNSYFDKDEKSIGGLKNPPPVNKGLYYLSLSFDLIAVILAAWKISLLFSILILIYGLVSKAYSHPLIRLKKYSIGGWLTIGFFQGFFTVLMCYVGINNFDLPTSLNMKVIFAGALSSLMLLGNYPMTQIYQHEEDAKRGDITISLKLGILGTFYFTILMFVIAAAGFLWFFSTYFEMKYALNFLLFQLPTVLFFFYWLFRVRNNMNKANYSHTMWLNFISAVCLNVFFVYLFLSSTGVLNVFS